MRVYGSVLLACWLTFILVWLFTSRKAKPSRRRTRFNPGTAMRVVLLVIAAFLARHFHLAAFRPASGAVAAAGCAVCAAGVAFAVWARLSLGENWGMPMTLRQNPELVTRGPYAFVRHPIYTGMTFAIVGTALVVPPYWTLAAIFVVYFVYSALREEKDMLAQFPEQYGAYKKRSKMFVPFLFLF